MQRANRPCASGYQIIRELDPERVGYRRDHGRRIGKSGFQEEFHPPARTGYTSAGELPRPVLRAHASTAIGRVVHLSGGHPPVDHDLSGPVRDPLVERAHSPPESLRCGLQPYFGQPAGRRPPGACSAPSPIRPSDGRFLRLDHRCAASAPTGDGCPLRAGPVSCGTCRTDFRPVLLRLVPIPSPSRKIRFRDRHASVETGNGPPSR